MPPTARELIAGRALTSVRSDTTVREAIALMVDGDYSQAPVLDKREYVVGLFTERRLAQEVHQGTIGLILDMPVLQFMEARPIVVGPQRSIYEVARLLATVPAVIVAEDRRAIGIVTDYDLAKFLAEWSEGIALVEDIEKRLRSYIELVYPTPNELAAALFRAFGPDRRDPTTAIKSFAELTLRDHATLITTDENWPRFEPYFTSKRLFAHYMELVRPIRNQIAHFRESLTPGQVATLKNVQEWLQRAPRVEQSAGVVSTTMIMDGGPTN